MAGEYAANPGRRRTYTILTGIILLTLPCYCAGFIALSILPGGAGSDSTATRLPTLTGQPTGTATITPSPVPSPTLGPPIETLPPTPSQFVPPSRTPTTPATLTPTPTASM